MHKQLLPIIVSMFTATAALGADTGVLTITISGLKNDKGVVRFALFNSADSFATKMSGSQAFRRQPVSVSNGVAVAKFADLPYGDYAVKCYHDEDNSGTVKKNMLGIPEGEFGFSGNADGSRGAPPFDKAKVTLNSAEMAIDIKAQHR